MVKVRFQGTKKEMTWLLTIFRQMPEVKVSEISEMYRNKGTARYFRMYMEAEPEKTRE